MSVDETIFAMSFSDALVELKAGRLVCRQGWNGKSMWLKLIAQDDYRVLGGYPVPNNLLPWIGMKTANGGFVPWLASQTDLLASDWLIVKEPW
jgi:hypothetical protein